MNSTPLSGIDEARREQSRTERIEAAARGVVEFILEHERTVLDCSEVSADSRGIPRTCFQHTPDSLCEMCELARLRDDLAAALEGE